MSAVISALTILPYYTLADMTPMDFFMLWAAVNAYLLSVAIHLTCHITETRTIVFYIVSFMLKVLLIYLHELSVIFPFVATLAMAASISTIILFVHKHHVGISSISSSCHIYCVIVVLVVLYIQ